MSFANTSAWAAAPDAGRYQITTFRKAVASAATVANDFIDYTYFSGNPPANFYASSPSVAAVVEAKMGINVPVRDQFIKSLTVMSAASSATNTTNQNQRLLLADYLLYYPFIDTDAIGEEQVMDNAVTLPRYNGTATFGAELVTNGMFPDDISGWSVTGGSAPYGVTWLAGGLNFAGSAAFVNVSQVVTLPLYKTLVLTYEVTSASAGSCRMRVSDYTGPFRSTPGTYSEVFSVSVAGSIFVQDTGGTFVGQVDNISLREVTSAGQGAQMIAVGQSASSTVGTFTVKYTNQDGVPNRTSQTTYTKVISGGGTLVSSSNNAVTGSHPFIGLQAGDSGVRSVESVTFSGAGGGLMAIVLVKPLFHFYSTQECRRTTTGNLESYGAASYFETVTTVPTAEIKSGAVLGVIGLGNAGSLASSVLVGTLETVW